MPVMARHLSMSVSRCCYESSNVTALWVNVQLVWLLLSCLRVPVCEFHSFTTHHWRVTHRCWPGTYFLTICVSRIPPSGQWFMISNSWNVIASQSTHENLVIVPIFTSFSTAAAVTHKYTQTYTPSVWFRSHFLYPLVLCVHLVCDPNFFRYSEVGYFCPQCFAEWRNIAQAIIITSTFGTSFRYIAFVVYTQ